MLQREIANQFYRLYNDVYLGSYFGVNLQQLLCSPSRLISFTSPVIKYFPVAAASKLETFSSAKMLRGLGRFLLFSIEVFNKVFIFVLQYRIGWAAARGRENAAALEGRLVSAA